MIKRIPKNTKTQVNTTLLGVKVIPAEGETPNCTLEYSIDGNVWTQHETVLTDVNNIIGSVARYIFLRFSQDVDITLE